MFYLTIGFLCAVSLAFFSALVGALITAAKADESAGLKGSIECLRAVGQDGGVDLATSGPLEIRSVDPVQLRDGSYLVKLRWWDPKFRCVVSDVIATAADEVELVAVMEWADPVFLGHPVLVK